MTNNIEKRLQQHNDGKTKSTKAYIPLEVVYKEVVADTQEARIREKYLKSGFGRKFIKDLGYS